MFTGKSPFKEDDDNEEFYDEKESETKTLLSQNQLISMLTARVPLPLAKLMLNLMGIEGLAYCYISAEEVVRELNQMLANLDSILSNSADQTALGLLHFLKGKLYGQDYNLSKLMGACDRIDAPDASKMVLVSGYSGVGKSSIVEHVKGKLKKKGVHFISG
eukprot:5484810-Ditylum_brightwellii.AAC.1